LILLTPYLFLRLWQRQTLTLWLIYVALSLGRIWVVFVNPREDVHRQGVMPDSNPFNEETVLSLWLDKWQEHIVHTRHFRGITLFVLEFEGTVMTKHADF